MRRLAMNCAFLRDIAELPSVFGFDVATGGIVNALMKYSTFDELLFFYPPGRPPTNLGIHEELGRKVRYEPISKVGQVLRTERINTWFQPDCWTEAINLRTPLAIEPFPFSTTIHIAWSPTLI